MTLDDFKALTSCCFEVLFYLLYFTGLVLSDKTSAIKGIKAVSICASVLKPRASAGSSPSDMTIDSTELVIV